MNCASRGSPPRVYGEKRDDKPAFEQIKGSPPRVRGKVFCTPSFAPNSGITPACAGKRPANTCRNRSNGDHPRVCGEKDHRRCAALLCQGSPPRVRGKVLISEAVPSSAGITPACAGKSFSGNFSPARMKDHPRVCGEKPAHAPSLRAPSGSPPRARGKEKAKDRLEIKTGSPPRARGKVPVRRRQRGEHGITPACAGKSPDCRCALTANLHHPRVRGEKPWPMRTAPSSSGSPPRVRGKADREAVAVDDDGITPACAGKSILDWRILGYQRDHPRVCGEKAIVCLFPQIVPGSPPRVRGKARYNIIGYAPAGITPARAGKRPRPTRWQSSRRDHPRACGEKIQHQRNSNAERGSPPRVRGKDKST